MGMESGVGYNNLASQTMTNRTPLGPLANAAANLLNIQSSNNEDLQDGDGDVGDGGGADGGMTFDLGLDAGFNANLSTDMNSAPKRRNANKGLPKPGWRAEHILVLVSWLLEHLERPYPTEDERVALMSGAEISREQLRTWLNNRRRRLKLIGTPDAALLTCARSELEDEMKKLQHIIATTKKPMITTKAVIEKALATVAAETPEQRVANTPNMKKRSDSDARIKTEDEVQRKRQAPVRQ